MKILTQFLRIWIMEIIKKFKVYVFLFVGMLILMSTVAMSSGKIRVFDFKYEEFKFLNGDIILELPDRPGPLYGRMYYKVLVDEYIDLTSGHGEVSDLTINHYKVAIDESFINKLITERILEHRNTHDVIFRWAKWCGKLPIAFVLMTSWDGATFPSEAEKQDRIRKDDEIFEHIIESFRYRKEDGTYAKPEIIRQEEQVKEIEYHGSEYHDNK